MLNIFLGYACNFSCSYCLQELDAPDASRKKHPVEPFIESVVPFVKKNGIKRIDYWGGEPFLYWDQIEAIHTAFEKESVEFDFVRITTNGSLLKPEHIKKLNDWRFYVVVSDHGKFGQPNWKLVSQLKKSSISFLFSAEDPYIWPLFEKIEQLEQDYQRTFWPYAHWVRATSGCQPKYYFTQDALDIHVQHLWQLAKLRVMGDRHSTNFFEGHIKEWRAGIAKTGPIEPLCHGNSHLSVDLLGNRYACHHSVKTTFRTGHLFKDSGPSDLNEKNALDHAWRWVKSSECSSCAIRSWCRGNCHISNTHEIDCRLSKEKHRIFSWIDENETTRTAA